ncbi:MAG: phosphoglucomutase/phosphomannomutase family protein [Clostridiales bacterium]|nr:phosphoglucomutase/phosphomannomutase family protein [Clostridiales bacterium]
MIKFGTGGWRAVIGDDFTRENIRRVAAAFVSMAKEENKADKPVIIGYDRRFLSIAAAKWVTEVIVKAGIKVWFLPRSAPTPLIMHTVLKNALHFGFEITASHNPSEYNGIKLIVEEGRDAPVEVTEKLEKIILSVENIESTDFDAAVKEGLVEYKHNLFNDYLDDITTAVDMKALRARGLRVLFDCMHGSGVYPLIVVFNTARCTIDTINLNRDAYFGGQMPAPSEESLQILKYQVKLGGYDFGIAMDGDGDRLAIIDKTGRYINANEILCLLYYYLVKYKGWRGGVVRNLATTHTLDAIAASFGEECYEVPVGFKYISAKIDEIDAVLGGESSGGLTVRGHIHGKDSVYAASLFSEMICVTGKSPSELVDEIESIYGRRVLVEDNLTFAPEKKEAVNRLIMADRRLPAFDEEIEKVNYIDGCKVYFKNGDFVICRFSGTEPLLRIFAESEKPEKAQSYIDRFKEFAGV